MSRSRSGCLRAGCQVDSEVLEALDADIRRHRHCQSVVVSRLTWPSEFKRETVRAPVPLWPFGEGERIAGRPVVAMDLIDVGDDRSVRVGRKLLADLVLGS